MKRLIGFTATLLASLPITVVAQTLEEDAAKFGSRMSVVSPSISPSGQKMLYIKPGVQSRETIYVVDLDSGGEPKAITSFDEGEARLSGCDWATEERIVCSIFGISTNGSMMLGFTRLVGFDADGDNARSLSPRTSFRDQGALQSGGRVLALDVEGEEDHILSIREYVKQSSENTRIYNDKEGLGVDRVNVKSGISRSVEKPDDRASGYIADEKGTVRIKASRAPEAGGYSGSTVRYFYRDIGSRDWLPLSVLDQGGDIAEGFFPVAVSTEDNVAYGFDQENGFRALYKVALDGSGKRERIMARDDVDVDGLIRIGRKRRVVGASYATEKRFVEYFDPALDRLASGLAKALPGKPLVSIVDASEDESRILLIASSDTDPGMLYLYEKETRSLSELLPLRDPLAGREMGKMTPITFPAADGTQIPGYLTIPAGSDGKNLPAIVMPHGGPGARDEWGFDWLVQFFVAQGYAVMQPNYRGSAGYGAAWFGKNGFKAWDIAISDVNDAGRWMISEGIANPEQLAAVGWSYGGYAALQSQVVDPDLFKAIAAIAPVTDLELLKEENRRYTNFLAYNRFIGDGPHVAAGSPARHAESFKAPVILVHGTIDQNVGVAHSKLMRDRLKDEGKTAEYVEFDGLDHYILHSQARGIMLKEIGEFLDTSLKK